MPLTFASLKDAIHHTLGGDPSAGASYARIINGAGRAWTAAREWYYLANREAELTTTAGSEWVALPADYLAFVAIVQDANGFAGMTMASATDFLEVSERGEIWNVHSYLGTLVQRVVDGQPAPWLRIYPTPQSVETFRLLYNATWGDVNDDEDVIPVPSYAEHVFEEWTRMYARGVDEEDSLSLGERMAACRAMPMFRDVVRRDALTTGGIVGPGRGAAEPYWRQTTRWNHANNLG